MRRTACIVLFTLLAALSLSSAASAWEISYEGDVMPNSSTLGSSKWSTWVWPAGFDQTSSDGSVLHMVDPWTEAVVPRYPYCYREQGAVPGGTPMTIEARVKVPSADTGGLIGYAVGFGVNAGLRGAFLSLWPDKVGTRYSNEDASVYQAVDLTQFHTFRIAMNGDVRPHFWVWMDGVEIFAGESVGGGDHGAWFGSSVWAQFDNRATFDSYWDYVRYSKEFLPVPEPSALLALAGGLGVIGLPFIRRRR